MRIVQNFAAEVDRLIQAELDVAGLVPEWSSPDARAEVPADALALIEPLIAEPAALAQVPARTWIPELLEAWRLGLIFLRDARSTIDARRAFSARRMVIREAWIGPYCVLAGDRLLIKGSYLSSHAAVDGPSAIIASRFRQHVALGPFVIITRTGAEAFAKIARFVRIDKSLVASNCALEGSTHAEQVPLGPTRRKLGVGIGPDCWIGQNASITSGAVLGRGVVVAPHTSITRRVPEFVFVSGTPPREFPIDFNIRGLGPEEAVQEGREQGMLAVNLPVFGLHQAAFAGPGTLEIDYAEHACLRDLATENLLHFQRGVLATSFAQLVPDHAADIRFTVGKTIRFTVHFDPPLAAALTVPDRGDPALFRKGTDGGMFVQEPEPAFLAQTWKWLVNRGAPLPPLEPAEPRGDAVTAAAAAPTPPPSGDVQAVIAAMVARLTNARGPLDPDAPFHTLGMDSLVAAELAVSVENHFNVVAPDVFRNNSVRKLAHALAQAPRL